MKIPLAATLLASSIATAALPIRCHDLSMERMVEVFKYLNAVPRPSGEEGKIAARIEELVKAIDKECWGGKRLLSVQIHKNNVLVTIPATGRFVGTRIPAIAIQGHLDMEVVTVSPEAKARYQLNGVDVVESNGYLISRDNQTTLGADNLAGVVMGLQYTWAPNLEHPALKLIFTTQEETDFSGAVAVPQKWFHEVAAIINLDTEDEGTFSVGAMGGQQVLLESHAIFKRQSGRKKTDVKIELSGLKGGHSGQYMHEKRAHAAFVMLELLQTLHSEKQFSLLDFNSGKFNGSVAILSSATVTVRVADDEVEQVKKRVSALLGHILARYTDDNPLRQTKRDPQPTDDETRPKQIEVKITQESNRRSRLGLSDEHLTRFLTLFGTKLEQGIRVNDPLYSHSHSASINLGQLKLDVAKKSICTEFFSKGYKRPDFERLIQENIARIKSEYPETLVDLFFDRGAWNYRPESWLVELVKARFPNIPLQAPLGILESGTFAERFPHIENISFGPQIDGAHSETERLSLVSWEKAQNLLHTLVPAIAENQGFQSVAVTHCVDLILSSEVRKDSL